MQRGYQEPFLGCLPHWRSWCARFVPPGAGCLKNPPWRPPKTNGLVDEASAGQHGKRSFIAIAQARQVGEEGFSDCCGMPFNKGHSHTEIVNLRDFFRSPHVRWGAWRDQFGRLAADVSCYKHEKEAEGRWHWTPAIFRKSPQNSGEVWFCERHQTRLKWDESLSIEIYCGVEIFDISIPRIRLNITTRGFPKIGVPQNGWFIMENPIKSVDLGVPLFSEISTTCCLKLLQQSCSLGVVWSQLSGGATWACRSLETSSKLELVWRLLRLNDYIKA